MKRNYLLLLIYYISISTIAFSQTITSINLQDAFKNGNIRVYNRELTLVNEASHVGIRLSKDFGEGIAWIKGIDFSDGIIEFDVRGENIKQHSFVGLAFHGLNDSTFDAIYLRPFQFKAFDETLRKRSVQYISLPDFTWQVLREKFPGKFESAITPSPDPNAWIKMRVVIKGMLVSVYINGNSNPCLVVEKQTSSKNGFIGFYVADTSGGDFANLTIIKTKN